MARWSLALIFLLVLGCAAGDYRKHRYYYVCEIPDYWIERMQGTGEVLPWKEYREEAWKHGVSPDTLGFAQGDGIWLLEGYSVYTEFHEIGHTWENNVGRYGHSGKCWSTEKPYGYDRAVLNAMEGL